jgi:hypothetical protein
MIGGFTMGEKENNHRIIALYLYKRGKEFIDESPLRQLDRTAYIFYTLIDELGFSALATKLHKYYNPNNI